MEDEYFSLESILADNHVSSLSANYRQSISYLQSLRNRCRRSGCWTLANCQKLSCTFTLDVPGLGYLEGGSEPDVSPETSSLRALTVFSPLPLVLSRTHDQIHQHQKLELPFWLAQTLSLKYVQPLSHLCLLPAGGTEGTIEAMRKSR
jgi:hypothetical protein